MVDEKHPRVDLDSVVRLAVESAVSSPLLLRPVIIAGIRSRYEPTANRPVMDARGCGLIACGITFAIWRFARGVDRTASRPRERSGSD